LRGAGRGRGEGEEIRWRRRRKMGSRRRGRRRRNRRRGPEAGLLAGGGMVGREAAGASLSGERESACEEERWAYMIASRENLDGPEGGTERKAQYLYWA
jgi:hypothetical protein